MKTLHILVIFVFLAFGLFETAHAQYGLLPSEQAAHSASLQQALAQAENTGDISIQNIQTLPPAIMVGQTFHINATLINNSPNPIFVGHGACEAPFSITFDTHVLVSVNNITCTTDMILQKLDPSEKITATSPYIDLVYKATEAGTTNATVTFSYSIWDPTTQSDIEKKISKSFLFTIYGNNTKPQCCGPAYVTPIPDSPLKQFKSGIPALDVKCNDGLQLILKAEDASPACVKPDTAQILTERGWAWNYANVVGKESISLSAYQGTSIETFYNNGTVASNFTINVNINNFKPSNASLVLQVYYNDGILYKTVNVPSSMIQPDGFYKYQLVAISDENHPAPFKVVATYNNETTMAYAPVFAHP